MIERVDPRERVGADEDLHRDVRVFLAELDRDLARVPRVSVHNGEAPRRLLAQ